MDRHTVYSLLGQWSIRLGIDGELLEFIDCIETINDPSEQSVLQVQVGLGSVRYEELTGICVRSSVRHRNHATVGVPEVIFKLILELTVPYGSSAFAGACRITRLDNEAFDVAMEQTVVVVITGAQGQEVLAGLGAIIAKQLQFDVSYVRVKCDRLRNNVYNLLFWFRSKFIILPWFSGLVQEYTIIMG